MFRKFVVIVDKYLAHDICIQLLLFIPVRLLQLLHCNLPHCWVIAENNSSKANCQFT